ncbi:unnamed protein product, partial [marine sediment metagenome]
EIGRFLVNNIGKITLPHIGLMTSVGAPYSGNRGFRPITT